MIPTIEYQNGVVRMIDQTRLPNETVFIDSTTPEEVGACIKNMVIRGAPAIGVAAALGASLAADRIETDDFDAFYQQLTTDCDALAQTRPTAVNLVWALERMKRIAQENKNLSVAELKVRLREEACNVLEEDVAINKAMGNNGQVLLESGQHVLTHCNAGALATAGYGTALGVIRAAVEHGKNISVFANETRPFLQGARLTAWELHEDNIPVTLITDNMCGHFMKEKKIDAVVVGADRIAANGDVANKIGTYMVAVLAQKHNIPFYVAAPISTLDLSLPGGEHIPIEQRSIEEVVTLNKTRIAPEGINAAHPAFDVTPNELVSAIITEKGVARAPFTESLKQLAQSA